LTKLLAMVGEPVDVHLMSTDPAVAIVNFYGTQESAVMYATARAAARVRRLNSSSGAAALERGRSAAAPTLRWPVGGRRAGGLRRLSDHVDRLARRQAGVGSLQRPAARPAIAAFGRIQHAIGSFDELAEPIVVDQARRRSAGFAGCANSRARRPSSCQAAARRRRAARAAGPDASIRSSSAS
jgi:hypothetical protein